MDKKELSTEDHIVVLRHLLNDLRSEAGNPCRHEAHNRRKREQAESLTFAVQMLAEIHLISERRPSS